MKVTHSPRAPQAHGPHQPGRARRAHLVLQGDAVAPRHACSAMKTLDLERVIYFQDYVVIDPGDTPLEEKQLLTEEQYRAGAREVRRASSRPTWAPRPSRSCSRGSTSTKLSERAPRGARRDAQRSRRSKDIIKRLQDRRGAPRLREPRRVDGPGRDPGDPAGPAPARPPRQRQLRDVAT